MHRTSDTLSFDGMFAAPAQVHGLTVVTRRLQDFTPFGVPLVGRFRVEVS
jgi:predicted nucleic acid-binding protein